MQDVERAVRPQERRKSAQTANIRGPNRPVYLQPEIPDVLHRAQPRLKRFLSPDVRPDDGNLVTASRKTLGQIQNMPACAPPGGFNDERDIQRMRHLIDTFWHTVLHILTPFWGIRSFLSRHRHDFPERSLAVCMSVVKTSLAQGQSKGAKNTEFTPGGLTARIFCRRRLQIVNRPCLWIWNTDAEYADFQLAV